LHAPECPIRCWCRAVRPWCRRCGALHGYGDSALDFRIEIPPLASRSVVTDHASWGARTWIWAPFRHGAVRIVDVDRESNLIDIESQRSLDIAHRQRDHFD